MVEIANEAVDLIALAELLQELDKIHNKQDPSRFPIFSLEKRQRDIEKLLKDGYIFLEKEGEDIIAFACVVKKGEKTLLIEHLFVKPEFQLRGIASRMLEHIFSCFKDKEIFASVYGFNHNAIQFYEKSFELSSLVFRKSANKTTRPL